MKRILSLLAVAGVAATLNAQTGERPMPRLETKDGRTAFLVDGAPYLMLGAQIHNSSSWPATLPKVWPAMEVMHVNTVEAPVYWEQIEPEQGRFDFSLVDTLLTQARQHKLRLVLLWFATYKNGSQHYMPVWMKLKPDVYTHLTGKDGRPVDSPSPFCEASLEADKKAFAAFMRHLKAADPQRTVIMVQVENEPGTWGSLRDYSPVAQKLFDAPVPNDVLQAMHVNAGSPSPTWQQAFPGAEADVSFHAWAVARYVGQVAAAGKAVYPLPLYANAALRDPIKPGAPGSYESGGPTDNVLSIWKVAAPALDILAPDIYINDTAGYLKVLDLYHRPDNPLFVPETGGGAGIARFLFAALGHQAIGFSPFGMDYTAVRRGTGSTSSRDELFQPWAQEYGLLAPIARLVARLNFEGKLQAVAEEKSKPSQALSFGSWEATVSYGSSRGSRPQGNAEPIGRALVAQLKDNEFLVTGLSARVDFRPSAPDKRRQFLRVEEVTYENGAFQFQRNWNGDETDWGLNFGAEPVLLRVSVATY